MTDHVMHGFLERQREQGMALAAASDLLTLVPLDGEPPRRYVAEFRCKGLVRSPLGAIREAERFAVGIWFPDDYLHRADPFQVLTWLAPRAIWHPNVSDQAPFVCAGRVVAGTALCDLLYQIFEIITYAKMTCREDDALNPVACAWARTNLARFPIDRRPLKRSATPAGEPIAPDFDVVEVPA